MTESSFCPLCIKNSNCKKQNVSSDSRVANKMLPIKCHNTQTCVSTFHAHCMSGVCLCVCVCLFIVAVITCCEVWQAAGSVLRTQCAGFNPFMQLTQCGLTVKMSKQNEENQNNRNNNKNNNRNYNNNSNKCASQIETYTHTYTNTYASRFAHEGTKRTL